MVRFLIKIQARESAPAQRKKRKFYPELVENEFAEEKTKFVKGDAYYVRRSENTSTERRSLVHRQSTRVCRQRTFAEILTYVH